MSMDCPDQYNKSGHLAESNLQIQCNPHQNPKSILHRILERTSFKLIWNNKKPRIAKTILYHKGSPGGITIPEFKLYYRAIVLKTTWYWHRDRQVDQRNRIEDPEMHPHTYGHLILDKGDKNIQWKKTAYLTNGSGSIGDQHAEKCKLTHS